MTDITPFRRKPKGSTTSQRAKSVTILNGNHWGVRFGPTGGQLIVNPDFAARAKAMTTGTQEDREALIRNLNLSQKTIDRISANARVLGLSFAQALSAELEA